MSRASGTWGQGPKTSCREPSIIRHSVLTAWRSEATARDRRGFAPSASCNLGRNLSSASCDFRTRDSVRPRISDSGGYYPHGRGNADRPEPHYSRINYSDPYLSELLVKLKSTVGWLGCRAEAREQGVGCACKLETATTIASGSSPERELGYLTSNTSICSTVSRPATDTAAHGDAPRNFEN